MARPSSAKRSVGVDLALGNKMLWFVLYNNGVLDHGTDKWVGQNDTEWRSYYHENQ